MRADVKQVVADVLASTPVFDGHNDLAAALRRLAGYSVEGLDRQRDELQTDLPRLRAGGVGAQFWSVFVPSTLPEPEAVVSTLEQVDAVRRLVARYPKSLQAAVTASDVERAWANGRIASLLGIEGGHSIARSLGVLRTMAALGVRYMTLTHNDNTAWADAATDTAQAGGLTEEGRAIVAEMNRIGMLVDLSHTSADTQLAALRASNAPVLYSHSSCRALSDHPRNANDEALEALAANGGVIQVTFVPAFVSEAVARWYRESEQAWSEAGLPQLYRDWPRAPLAHESAARLARERSESEAAATRSDAAYEQWLARHPRPAVTVADVADHVDHAREVAGVDHVGLGGDYDGIDVQPHGLEDVSGYPRLLAELAERGWPRADLEKLTGRNVLRVLRAAEDAAAEPLWSPWRFKERE